MIWCSQIKIWNLAIHMKKWHKIIRCLGFWLFWLKTNFVSLFNVVCKIPDLNVSLIYLTLFSQDFFQISNQWEFYISFLTRHSLINVRMQLQKEFHPNVVFVTWMWQLKWRQLLEWPLLNSKMKKKTSVMPFFFNQAAELVY